MQRRRPLRRGQGVSDTAADSKWEKVVPGGDCECVDGSEFAFWERQADPTKVVLFLDGGGTCSDAESCAFTTGEAQAYDWNVRGDDPSQDDGIFDFARADNPFSDHSFILVPSCTGGVHLGDVTREYSRDLTVEHNGFVNGTAALNYLAEQYPDATQVVVGKSVGVGRRPPLLTELGVVGPRGRLGGEHGDLGIGEQVGDEAAVDGCLLSGSGP